MSESVTVMLRYPVKAKKPHVLEAMAFLEDNGFCIDYRLEDELISCVEFEDSSLWMLGMHKVLDMMTAANVPFDLSCTESIETPETHIIFRPGYTKTPYKYYGKEPMISVDTLRSILSVDPDYVREHLIEYLDDHFPEVPSLETATMEWEEKNNNAFF